MTAERDLDDTTSPADGLGPLSEALSAWTVDYAAACWQHKHAAMKPAFVHLLNMVQGRIDAAVAAERVRMGRLYEVVSRMVEQDHVVNLTRLHDYCADEPGLSAEAVDGGPADAYEASIAAAERERCAKLCDDEAERWRANGQQDIADFRLCASRIRVET